MLYGDEKTTSHAHPPLWPWLYRKAVGNTAPANSGNRGPSPLGDAAAREPMRCLGGVAWQEVGVGSVSPILMSRLH